MIPVILLAFANDRQGQFLRSIAEEQRAIRKALDPLVQRKLVQVETLSNATAGDIFEAFRTYGDRIRILHYGGHAQDLELMLSGAERPLDVKGLATFLGQQGLELVFMNGCATAAQQPVLQRAKIPSLILTNTAINDRAAQQFASQFYQSMAAGRTVSRSFSEAEGATIAQLGSETRGLVLDEEESDEPESLPWRLHKQSTDGWTLPTKAPFPTRLALIALAALMLLGVGGYSLWRFVIPFDMQVQVVYPEGTNDNQFGPGKLMQHNLQLLDPENPQNADLDKPGLTSFIKLKGRGRKVPIDLKSNIFVLKEAQLK
ncbi:MAG: CHAT domain-containing protein, partial [Bacteroidota bacterium]